MREEFSGQKFSKDIYPPQVVKQAAKQYAEHVKINVSRDDTATYVDFSAVDPENRDRIEGEFCNYVLYLNLTKEGRSGK